MGATSSVQRDSRGEEPHTGQNEVSEEDSTEERLLQNNRQISSLNGKAENQLDGLSDQCNERIITDDAVDTTQALQEEEVSQANTANLAQQMDNTDIIADDENIISNKLNEPEVGFKKIFRFGGFKFTLRKDKVDKTDAEEPGKIEQDMKAVSPSVDSWDTIEEETVSINNQDEEEMGNDPVTGDVNTESTETDNKEVIGQTSEFTEDSQEITPDKGEIEDEPQNPEFDGAMSPIKFITQGIFGSLKRKKKVEDTLKESTEEELKKTDKDVQGLCVVAQDDSTCACLDFSNITLEEEKDSLTDKRDENKSKVEGLQTSVQDEVQPSPFKRLFRKLSTRRHKEIKFTEENLTEPAKKLTENVQSAPELLQKEEELNKAEHTAGEEDVITRPEEPKKRSDSIVSWEALICGGSLKRRARKTSDCEDEMQIKGELTRKTTDSPTGSSTESDYNNLASSNEQIGSHADTESSTWKSFKKLVTPKRKGKMDERGSPEQIPSDTELTKDESSCSIRKLISLHKKKSDVQSENVSSEEESRGTGIDNEDDETPLLVPMSDYEVVEPDHLEVMTEQTIESTLKKDVHPMNDEDKPEQKKPSYDAVVPVSSDFEDLTEFLSKHQQLSDIPEEGIIEESVATPVSFVEWTTQGDTLAEDVADMTADAVTAPEHATEESNGDETTEMVSALSQLTESQQTSGNATPDLPLYDEGKSGLILQEVTETICMTPSVLAIIINDKDPESLSVSVSPHIVESATSTETKVLVSHSKEEATAICVGLVSQDMEDVQNIIVESATITETNVLVTHSKEEATAICIGLVSQDMEDVQNIIVESATITETNVLVTHSKEEATAICIGLVSQDMEDVQKILPLPILEGIFETNVDVPIELVSGKLTEEPSKAKTSTDRVYVPEIKDLKDKIYDAVSLESNTTIAETMGKSKQEIPESAHDKVSHVIHTEGREVYSTQTQLLSKQVISKDINTIDTECSLSTVLERPSYEQSAQSTEVTIGGEREHRRSDAESKANNIQGEVAGSAANTAIASGSDNSEASEIKEDAQVSLADTIQFVTEKCVVSLSQGKASEITEDVCQDTLAEGTVLVANNVMSSVHESVLNEASEITEHSVQVAQADNVELEAHGDALAVAQNIMNGTSVALVTQAEGVELVAHNSEMGVTENILNGASEIPDQADQVTLVEDVELVVYNDLVLVPESILGDASEIMEDVAVAVLTDGAELVAYGKEVSVTDSTLHEASERAEDGDQITLVDDVELATYSDVVSVPEVTLRDTSEIIENVVPVTLSEDVELIAHNDLVLVPENILGDASEIMENVVKVTEAEDNVYVANNVASSVTDSILSEASEIMEDDAPKGFELVAYGSEVSVTDSTLYKASEMAEDVDKIILVDDVELATYSDVVSVPEVTLKDTSEIIENVFPVRLSEDVELVAHDNEEGITENTLHEASEIPDQAEQVTLVGDVELATYSDVVSVPEITLRDTSEIIESVVPVTLSEDEHVDQVTLVEDVELVAHNDLAIVPESILEGASEIMEIAVKVTEAEDNVYAANNVISSVTDSTFNEASEIMENVAPVMLTEGAELVAYGKEVSVTDRTLHESSEMAEDVDQIILVEDVELATYSDVVSVPEITLRDTSEIIDVVPVTLSEDKHLDQVTLVEDVELVAHDDLVLVPESILGDASEIMENVVKVTEAEDNVYAANNVVSSVTHSILNEASEIMEDVELVAYGREVAVTDSTLHEASEMAEDVNKVRVVEDGELVALIDAVPVPEITLSDASEITEEVAHVPLAEDVELMAATESTLYKASEITEDVHQVTLVEDGELVTYSNEVSEPAVKVTQSENTVTLVEDVELLGHSDLVLVPESILRDASESIDDVVKVTEAEDNVCVANNVLASETDSVLNKASEIADQGDQFTLVENIKLVAHSDLVSVPENILRDVLIIIQDVVKVAQAEDNVCVANSVVSSVSDSTLNEASEITEDAHVTPAEGVELVAHENEVVLTDSTLHEASEIAEDVDKVRLVEDGELVALIDAVQVPGITLSDASEIIEEVAHVPLAEDVELMAATDSTLYKASEITEDAHQVTLVEDGELVTYSNEVSVPAVKVTQSENTVDVTNSVVSSVTDGPLNEASEITNDVVEVTLAKDVELVAHSYVVSVSERRLKEASEMMLDVEVTQAEDSVSVVDNALSLVPDSVSNEALESKDDDAQITEDAEKTVHNLVPLPLSTLIQSSENTDDATQPDDTFMSVAHKVVISVPGSTFNEVSEITEDNVHVSQTEVAVSEGHSDAILHITDSSLHEASENIEDIAHVILAEEAEFAENTNVVLLPDGTLNEVSEITEDVVQVTQTGDVELSAHTAASMADSTEIIASVKTEDVVHFTQAEYTVLESHRIVISVPDCALNEGSEVTEVTQAAVGISVGQRFEDLLPDHVLITEDTVQSTQAKIVQTVTHDVMSLEPVTTMIKNTELTNNNEASTTDTSKNKASEMTGGMTRVFPSNTREAMGTLHSVSDSIQVEAEKIEDANFISLHLKSSHEIHTKVNNSEIKTAKMNTESVLHAEEMTQETAQKTESISEQDSRDTAAEKIVHSTALESIPEPDGPACKEKDMIVLVHKHYLPTSSTHDKSRAVEEEEVISNVTQSHGTECTETETTLLSDQNTKQTTGGEIFMITLNENKPAEQNQQAPAISEEAKLHEKLVEEECHPLPLENLKPESQEHYTVSKMSIHTETRDVAPYTETEESTMTKETEEPCTDKKSLRSDTFFEDMKERREALVPEVHSEIFAIPQETLQNVSSANYESEVDTQELHSEIFLLKSEESKANETSPEPCKKDSIKLNETLSFEALTYVEDASQSNDEGPNEINQTFKDKCIASKAEGMKYNIDEQPVTTVQHFDEAPGGLTTATMEVDQGNIIKDTSKVQVYKQHPGGCITPIIEACKPVLETVIVSVTQITGEVLSEQKVDTIVSLEKNTEINKQEIVPEMNTETQCIVLEEETITYNNERQITRFSEKMTEMVSETLALTEAELQKMNDHKIETLEETKSITHLSVPVVLLTDSAKEKNPENTLEKTSTLISVTQTEDMIPFAPVPSVCAVLTNTEFSAVASEEGDTNVNTSFELDFQEPKFNRSTSETAVFTELNMQTTVVSACETETSVVTFEEMGLSSFPTTIDEPQLKSVITMEELLQEGVAPAIQMPAEVLVQEPEMVAEYINETKLDSPGEVLSNTSNIDNPIIKETQETPVETELEVKATILTSVLTDHEVKKKPVEMFMLTEGPAVVPFIKLSTSTVSLMIETLDSSMENTVKTELNEGEKRFREPEEKERPMDAPVAANIEINQSPLIEREVNSTEATQQDPLKVKSTESSEEVNRCTETMDENWDPVSMGKSAETLPAVDDDLGDVKKGVKDDGSAPAKPSVDLHNAPVSHEH